MDQSRWLLLALALLPAIPGSENFEVTSPQNVVGVVGQDTILPCTISSTKPLDNLEVEWRKIIDGYPEDIYRYRQSGGEATQKYLGRTSVPGDGFATGNVSLTLRNVQPADEGTYNCLVTFGDWSADTATKLSIAGTGEVFLEILGPQGQGLELGCRSHGWFPKPAVQWVTEDGQGLSADTEIHQDSRKLFSVWSRVTVTGEQVGNVTCQILNPLMQMEKKITVRLSGAAFQCVSPFVPAFWTVLILLLLVLAAAAVLIFQGRNCCMSWISCRGKREKPFHAEQTVESKIAGELATMLQRDDHQLSKQIQNLQEAFQNLQESTQHEFQLLRAELEKKGERIEETNKIAMESMWKDLQGIFQKIQTCQKQLESTQQDLQPLRTELDNKLDASEGFFNIGWRRRLYSAPLYHF